MTRQLLYSLTKKDFIVQHFKGSGAGGQHRNKCSTAVRIIHPESGARGESQECKSQIQNKKLAFNRMMKTKEFQLWHKRKIGQVVVTEEEIRKKVDDMMRPENLLVETF